MTTPARRRSELPADVVAARARAEVIAGAEDVAAAIDRVSVRISLDLADANPLVLTVMHGALMFAGALLPRWNFPLEVGYLHVSRYQGGTRGGSLNWHARPDYEMRGRTVLVIDDVLDHGDTLAAVVEWVREQGVPNVLTVVLVDKLVDRARPITADYVALTCPDRYLFGCGMDYKGYWRNLPAIYALPAELETR